MTRWATQTLALLLGGPRRSNTCTATMQGGPEPRVYRVQLLALARCPAPLASPCYTAVVR